MRLFFRYPDKPITASLQLALSKMKPKDWLVQAKYDGWRIQIYINEFGDILCFTRTGKLFDEIKAIGFDPQIKILIKSMNLPSNTAIDAEYVGPRGKQKPAIYIFDMLAWDGKWLADKPYQHRWRLCQNLKLPKNGNIYLAETAEGAFGEFYKKLKSQWDGKNIDLWEGIVLKRRTGTLILDRNSSKKSHHMFRVKYRDIKSAQF